jgi:hypothetical protein
MSFERVLNFSCKQPDFAQPHNRVEDDEASPRPCSTRPDRAERSVVGLEGDIDAVYVALMFGPGRDVGPDLCTPLCAAPA